MIKNYIEKLSQKLFQDLKSQEQLGLLLHSENSTFIRFSKSLVRQNSTVNQHEITLQFQKDERVSKMRYNLTLDEASDLKTGLALIADARKQLMLIDRSPSFSLMKNNGTSNTTKKVDRPHDLEIPNLVHSTFKDTDLAGLWCSGPLHQASLNSEGQAHFFESDYFFFDYSLYNGPKAAKGYYSAEKFSAQEFINEASLTKNKLNLLNRPTQKVERGQHDVYLEPMALAEIMGTVAGWGGFSQSTYNKGRAPLKKLKEKQSAFSTQINIQENFDLGLAPLFNSMGELSPQKLDLIKNGEIKNMLISSETAQEYNLVSNFADLSESPRSMDMAGGSLDSKMALQKLNKGLYLSNLHYINYSDLQTARITGMTRFACFWVENGEIVGPIQDLRFDESLYNIFGSNLVDLSMDASVFVDTATYLKRNLGAFKVPGALIKNFNFTL